MDQVFGFQMAGGSWPAFAEAGDLGGVGESLLGVEAFV
jgi:hypothetical protein